MTLLHGDCLEVMPTLDADSIDAIVTDPPYGLAFMGKAWDHGVPGVPFWTAALRVAKPGAHLLAFGGTRTYHRLTCAIEDAGWEIRDCLMWLYGSGFPKSLDVSKAMDKAAGAERPVLGYTENARPNRVGKSTKLSGAQTIGGEITEPLTEGARRWSGWGTALKPAWEPIILARKPLRGTVASNVAAHGTGALNIDGCRIEGTPRTTHADGNRIGNRDGASSYTIGPEGTAYEGASGRWPANVVLDEEAARRLDEQSGELKAGMAVRSRSGGNTFGGDNAKPPMPDMAYGDSGGASRFFYTAKASRAERNAGLDGFEAKRRTDGREKDIENPRLRTSSRANHHPTVKPLDLMQWLCRLVTPKGGVVLDPFMGSGTTGRAAVAEGFRFVGIEKEAEYLEIARARIAEYAPLFAGAPDGR